MEGGDISMREELADMFSMSRDLVYQHLEGFGEDALRQAPAGGGNAGLWILAHLTVGRRALIALLTDEVEPAFPWEDLAERGTGGEVGGLPGKDELLRLFENRHNTLVGTMRSVTDAFLEQCPEGTPIWRRRLILARFLHEAYHVGQLAILRRLAGLDGVVK